MVPKRIKELRVPGNIQEHLDFFAYMYDLINAMINTPRQYGTHSENWNWFMVNFIFSGVKHAVMSNIFTYNHSIDFIGEFKKLINMELPPSCEEAYRLFGAMEKNHTIIDHTKLAGVRNPLLAYMFDDNDRFEILLRSFPQQV